MSYNRSQKVIVLKTRRREVFLFVDYVVKDKQTTNLHKLTVSLNIILPTHAEIKKVPFTDHIIEVEHGVSMEISNQRYFLLSGHEQSFMEVSQQLFNIHLSPRMISSFTYELANMIAGTFVTLLSLQGETYRTNLPQIRSNSTIIGYRKAEKWTIKIGEQHHLSLYFLDYC